MTVEKTPVVPAVRSSIEEGQTVSLAEDVWMSLSPVVGTVLEFHLATSSLVTSGDDAWAALLIDGAEEDGLKGWKIQGRFLGTEASALEAEIARYVRGPGLHLCSTTPCVYGDAEGLLHVTSIRWWQPANFVAGYLNREGKRLLKELEDAARRPPEEPGPTGPGGRGRAPRGTPKGTAKATAAKPKRTPKRKATPSKTRSARDPVIEVGSEGESEEQDREEDLEGGAVDRRTLREMLRRTRLRMQGGAGLTGPRQEEEEDSSGGAGRRRSRRAVEEKQLVAGAGLNPRRPTQLQLADQEVSRDGGMHGSLKKMAKSKDLNNQLLAVAAQRRGSGKERRKEKKGDKNVKKAIQLLSRRERKKKKKKRKKKKKERGRRIKREYGSDDSGGSSGGESSSSSDSEDSKTKSSDSDLDFEPPLRKKALTSPGSVMEMLIKHAQDQLDRGAILEGENQGPGVTTGIKVSTYTLP